MLQVYVNDVDSVLQSVLETGVVPYKSLREVWRKVGHFDEGQREFFVQDPDGYLLMIAQILGRRPS
jgi:hypothetical protein